jgi:polyhydroxybutyrate depolymerase
MRRAFLGCALYVTGMTLASPSVAEQLVVDKSTRTYAIEKPAASGPQPTIIMLGAHGTGAEVARSSKLGTLAPQQGFVAVFPDVPQPQWNFHMPAKRSFWNFFRSAAPDDGIFLKALVSDLVHRGIADRQRIYLAGESGGSVMALRMLCTDASLFAGIALLGPAMPERLGSECHPSRPVPILLINGTKDEVYPYAGGPIAPDKTFSVWPNERLIGFLQQVNNHSGAPRTSSLPIKVPNTVAVDRWESCSGALLTAYRVIDGPHAVPADLNAAQAMINFFVAPKQGNACVAALPGSGANPGQAPGATPNRNTSAPGADPNSQSSTPGATPGSNNTPNTAAGNPGAGGSGASGNAPSAGGTNASDLNAAGGMNAPGGAPSGSASAPGGAPGGTGGLGSPGDPGNPGTNTAGLGPPNDPGNPGTNTAGLGPPNDPGNPGTNTAGLGPPPDNANPGTQTGGLGPPPDHTNPGTQTGGLGPPPDHTNPGTQTAGLGPPPNHTNPGTQTGGLGPPPHSPAGNPPLVSLPTPPIFIPIPMAPPNVCKPQPPSMSGSGCHPTPQAGNMCHPKPPVGCDPTKTAAPATPPHPKPATPLVLRPNPSTTAAVSPPPSPGMIHLKPAQPAPFVPASVTPTGPAHDDALKKKKEAEKKQAEKKQAEKKQAEKKHAEKKLAERREAQRREAQRQQYQDAMTTAATAAAIISIAGGMRRGGGGGGYSGGHRPMGGHGGISRRRH